MCIFKTGLSNLSDGWAKCKEKVPDVSDSDQNDETTCNCKLKFTELKRFIYLKATEKLFKDELCCYAANTAILKPRTSSKFLYEHNFWY